MMTEDKKRSIQDQIKGAFSALQQQRSAFSQRKSELTKELQQIENGEQRLNIIRQAIEKWQGEVLRLLTDGVSESQQVLLDAEKKCAEFTALINATR
ncbi:MAG: hypothetical protein ABI432_09375 [Flavobacteriales bacterium]